MADIDVHNANRGEIIIYRAEDNTIQLDVRMENETVWLNLNQMAMLFDRDKSVISRHIRDVFRERELSKEATVAKNATVYVVPMVFKQQRYSLSRGWYQTSGRQYTCRTNPYDCWKPHRGKRHYGQSGGEFD